LQGSCDSTVPSPLPRLRCRLNYAPHLQGQPLTPTTPDYDQNQHPLPIPIPRSKIYDKHDKLEPPSPDALTERLKSISPRENQNRSSQPSPLGSGALELQNINEETVNGWSTTLLSPAVYSPEKQTAPSPGTLVWHAKDNEEEVALKESIRSVYRLWKMSRRLSGEDDRDVFMRVTREAVGLPYGYTT